MTFSDGKIEGVVVTPLTVHEDRRGSLTEVFRSDELVMSIEMGYVSVTKPGIGRGPHEHVLQSDVFCFPGPGIFEIRLWDRRPGSATFGESIRLQAGTGAPAVLVIPPGVVHGYRNISAEDGLVINLPNRLYRGEGKQDEVDEIRHEDEPDSPFGFED